MEYNVKTYAEAWKYCKWLIFLHWLAAAEFTYDRGKAHQFGSFMQEDITEESEVVEDQDALADSGGSSQFPLELSDIDQGNL